MAAKTNLTVNGHQIEMNPFVEAYVYQLSGGIVASLKDTGAIKQLLLEVKDNADVKMTLNGKDVPLNFFATEIIRNTLAGMVANLKGAEGGMKTLEIKIEQ
jgi:hypothetical protein